ncbi:MAG TPA: phosphatidylserine/phosphatidylglycerophosphate/cardiolipin synthase family protein [Candidatus Binatia bacterium]|nr:phosphatidylserine/phosphatidylglycerophosphate/cardiolipin synthase family protein [Candidatus Binatia bacterium]
MSLSPRIPAAREASYPLRGGNKVRPLVDGLPAFRAICEAVSAARRSVWVTVAFLDEDFALPDGRGSLFDVLERAARQGLDVRVLFWSEPEIEQLIVGSAHFPASEAAYRLMAERAPHVLARWDRVEGYCHHQKSWMIDAGADTEVVFVGGINLDVCSLVSPGHPGGEATSGASIHDAYVELRGPSATDVHHNFVQRWNEASERETQHGCFPVLELAGDLPFPTSTVGERGGSLVQVARTIQSDLYRVGTPVPGGSPFAIGEGEFSIVEQYLAAVDAAERTIYLENQILLCPFLLERMEAALQRGVDVTVLVPALAMPEICRVRTHPRVKPVFDMLDAFADYENFLLAGLGSNRAGGGYDDIYVHAKLALIDDEWTTIGSANAMFRSFRGDTEMNVTFWDQAATRELRRELFAEHLGEPINGIDDRAALAFYRERAIENRRRRDDGKPMRGQVFAMAPSEWAVLRED